MKSLLDAPGYSGSFRIDVAGHPQHLHAEQKVKIAVMRVLGFLAAATYADGCKQRQPYLLLQRTTFVD